MNYLPKVALNHDPPDLCLLSSWDYRREPLVPYFLNKQSCSRISKVLLQRRCTNGPRALEKTPLGKCKSKPQ
jgi:hypothetical protein